MSMGELAIIVVAFLIVAALAVFILR